MKPQSVLVTGSTGMVGSAIVRRLGMETKVQVLSPPRSELDLMYFDQVAQYLESNKPTWIICAAARVGGIVANRDYPADFLTENLSMQTNIIRGGYEAGVSQLLFLGSSCIYPKITEQPIKESQLLSGYLEPTNEPYAIAKIAGLKMCEAFNRQYGTDYRTLMPTNLYGPNDNFHPEHSHVVPALIQRFHNAKMENSDTVTIWGSGRPRRELLYVEDLADAVAHVITLSRSEYTSQLNSESSHINVGTGEEIAIAELANLIAETIGFTGDIAFDTGYPDGTLRKRLDVTKLTSLGWSAKTNLRQGLEKTYNWFCANQKSLRTQ